MADLKTNVVYMPVLARNPVYPPWSTNNQNYGEYYRGGHGHSLFQRWYQPKPGKYGEVNKSMTETQKMISKQLKNIGGKINTYTEDDMKYIRSRSVPPGGMADVALSHGCMPLTPQPADWSLNQAPKDAWVGNPHVKPRPKSPRIRSHSCFNRPSGKRDGFLVNETGIRQRSQCLDTQQIISSGNGAWVFPNMARELGMATDEYGRLTMLTSPKDAIQKRVDEHTYKRRHGPDISPVELEYLLQCSGATGPKTITKLIKRRTTNGTYGSFMNEYEEVEAI